MKTKKIMNYLYHLKTLNKTEKKTKILVIEKNIDDNVSQ